MPFQTVQTLHQTTYITFLTFGPRHVFISSFWIFPNLVPRVTLKSKMATFFSTKRNTLNYFGRSNDIFNDVFSKNLNQINYQRDNNHQQHNNQQQRSNQQQFNNPNLIIKNNQRHSSQQQPHSSQQQLHSSQQHPHSNYTAANGNYTASRHRMTQQGPLKHQVPHWCCTGKEEVQLTAPWPSPLQYSHLFLIQPTLINHSLHLSSLLSTIFMRPFFSFTIIS